MKTTARWVMTATGMVLSCCCATWAAEDPSARLITVAGDAEIRVVPDEVILTLGVETVSKILAEAKADNDRIVHRALEVAGKHGVEKKHVQTDYVHIEPRYEDRGGTKEQFLGYFVRKNIVITLRNLSEFEGLLTGMLEVGVTHVHGIDFRTTELRKQRDRARALAIGAAREKAEALAGELDQKIGSPHRISEQRTWWWSGYGGWWGSRRYGRMSQNVVQSAGGGMSGGESALAPGQIAVSATVSVTFELQ